MQSKSPWGRGGGCKVSLCKPEALTESDYFSFSKGGCKVTL